jgi:hypothetical protein
MLVAQQAGEHPVLINHGEDAMAGPLANTSRSSLQTKVIASFSFDVPNPLLLGHSGCSLPRFGLHVRVSNVSDEDAILWVTVKRDHV